MKKIVFALASLAALITLAFVNTSCSGEAAKNNTVSESVVAVATDAATPVLNIRFVDMDSVLMNYNLAKEISEHSQGLMMDLQKKQRQKETELNQLGSQIQNKVQNNGYLSEASYNADVKNLQNKQNQAERYLATEQQKAQEAMAQQEQRLMDSINSYIKVYNAVHNYDAIIFRSATLIYNPALDITAEVLDGLNARYPGK